MLPRMPVTSAITASVHYYGISVHFRVQGQARRTLGLSKDSKKCSL